ncbi:MAG: ATP-binding protein [Okeania sp. SIO3B5]|uniref:ATP-binding protein n=1 Tax=Okeania sp. SIO3B5 TaxID=2607811 RepID=UPI0014019748|nr:ATP-binding protein [Okeania sp. SIO3B5]NEO58549.1 ATP-binding protein [Okeania sp. SIO3B5]
MSNGDEIWDELGSIYDRWGIEEIPFSESASTIGQAKIQEVFTGRTKELREVLHLFRGRERKRLLVYGWIGIGKTAFILEILGILQRNKKNTITAYISLPQGIDLATAALIALAREMEDDEWAQQQLNQMGLRPQKALRRRKIKGKGGLPVAGVEVEEEVVAIQKPQFPSLSFEDLLQRALEKNDSVVIAIDDLDKQDPAKVRQLLLDAQGILKSGAWFILTGHPFGLTRDILIGERGLFDLALKLEEMDMDTTYEMLVKYLNSARPKESQLALDAPEAVAPFTPETARLLCERSSGVPRWLNRLGSYILLKAAELGANIVTPEILQQGFAYADQKVRGQLGLTPEDFIVLELVLEKGILSDANVTVDDLQRIKVNTFSEILPILDKLIQRDLLRRLPSDRTAEYAATPLLLPPTNEEKEED